MSVGSVACERKKKTNFGFHEASSSSVSASSCSYSSSVHVSTVNNGSKPLKIPQSSKCSLKGTRPSQCSSSAFSHFVPSSPLVKEPPFFSGESQPIFSIEDAETFAELAQKASELGNIFTFTLDSKNQNNNASDSQAENDGNSSGFNSDLEDGDESPFYSSDIDSDTESEAPILWNFADYFSSLPGNDWCARIPQSFIDDEFNLFELPNVFKCPLTLTDYADKGSRGEEGVDYTFDDLLDFISIEDLSEDPITKLSTDMINDAVMLYKLIHQRYIMTKSGLQAMWEKFDNHAFGTCPRYLCHDQALLPVGPSAVPDAECLRVYCLHCQDLYRPFSAKHCKADGLPFGPTFAHFFVRTVLYANPHKAAENRKGEHDWQIYVPKIYGFRLFRQGEMNCGGIRTERPLHFK